MITFLWVDGVVGKASLVECKWCISPSQNHTSVDRLWSSPAIIPSLILYKICYGHRTSLDVALSTPARPVSSTKYESEAYPGMQLHG